MDIQKIRKDRLSSKITKLLNNPRELLIKKEDRDFYESALLYAGGDAVNLIVGFNFYNLMSCLYFGNLLKKKGNVHTDVLIAVPDEPQRRNLVSIIYDFGLENYVIPYNNCRLDLESFLIKRNVQCDLLCVDPGYLNESQEKLVKDHGIICNTYTKQFSKKSK